jgi:hypothetical protein
VDLLRLSVISPQVPSLHYRFCLDVIFAGTRLWISISGRMFVYCVRLKTFALLS